MGERAKANTKKIGGIMSENTFPTPRELSSEEQLELARIKGRSFGFDQEFLDHFVENELRLQQKWKNKGK